MKYIDLLKANNKFESTLTGTKFRILALQNVTITPLKAAIEYQLRLEGVNANVEIGNYDNIIQDSKEYDNQDAVIVFLEPCNIIEGFQYKIETLDVSGYEQLYSQTVNTIDLLLKNLYSCKTILFNLFSPYCFSCNTVSNTALDIFCGRINSYLHSRVTDIKLKSLFLIDINKIIINQSIESCINWRDFYSSKLLYSTKFFMEYAKFVTPIFMSIQGKSKKVLVFDCDNTLWGGVLGEDGFDHIDMSPLSGRGAKFAEIQGLAKSLSKSGVIIGINSKNNHKDVLDVINNHKDMILKDEDISIYRVNWSNKAQNLKEIAADLNLALDSFVFIDDSEFEIELIKEALPTVKAIQVPDDESKYPLYFRRVMDHFYKSVTTNEDKNKAIYFKQDNLRREAKDCFTNISDYLQSLQINLEIYLNNPKHIERAAQMTQKTNQFNLTTRRYTAKDIEELIFSPNYNVYTLSVSDKFGDSGITGLAILKVNNESAMVDSFLLSCRILGREIDTSFADFIFKHLKLNSYKTINAEYLKSARNQQVESFWDRFGFEATSDNGMQKTYIMNLDNYQNNVSKYVKISFKAGN